jgi:hypothetical protein
MKPTGGLCGEPVSVLLLPTRERDTSLFLVVLERTSFMLEGPPAGWQPCYAERCSLRDTFDLKVQWLSTTYPWRQAIVTPLETLR